MDQDSEPTDVSYGHAVKLCQACQKSFLFANALRRPPCGACPVLEVLVQQGPCIGTEAHRLTEDEVALVRGSFASLQPDLTLFARAFYIQLFADYPNVRLMFSGNQWEQERKLAMMLVTMVKGLERLAEIKPAVRALGQRHAHYGVRPVDYAAFGRALMVTLEVFLKDAFSPEVRGAWAAFYRLITGLMLGSVDWHVAIDFAPRRAA